MGQPSRVRALDTGTTRPYTPAVTLDEIRTQLGASGVANAIRRALAAHDTVTAAAESLGTTPRALRRSAQRAGVAWPDMPPGRPVASKVSRKRLKTRAFRK